MCPKNVADKKSFGSFSRKSKSTASKKKFRANAQKMCKKALNTI